MWLDRWSARSSGVAIGRHGTCLAERVKFGHLSIFQQMEQVSAMHDRNRPGSRCETPHFPQVPVAFPPSLAVDGEELDDTGCRAVPARPEGLIDFITAPPDAARPQESFRC